MPIYEYQCDQCHRRFELIQGFDAPLKISCQHCSGKAHRLISPPAVVFKGSGFHVTDYPKSGGKPVEKKSDVASPSPKKKNGPQEGKAPPAESKTGESKKNSDSAKK